MRITNGFIKLYRNFPDWGWYQDNVVKSVFLHLLLTASITDCEWMGYKIKKGQVVISYGKLAEETGNSVQQVRTAIKKLKMCGEITCKSTNQFTVVTIEKWGKYQSYPQEATYESTNGQQTDNKRATNEQQHNKNIKNNKNIKKEREYKTDTLSQNVYEFIPPSAEEVKAYCRERGNSIDAERFTDYYSARGWSTGSNKMTDWRAAVRAWEKTEKKPEPDKPVVKRSAFNNFSQKPIDYEAVEKKNRERLLEKWGGVLNE